MSSPPSEPENACRHDPDASTRGGSVPAQAVRRGGGDGARWSARQARVRWPAARRRPARTPAGLTSRCRSAASTRPASSRRSRIGCTSARSTSRPTTATTSSRCCKQWTEMAERMTRGRGRRARTARSAAIPYAPPTDTGEALGLPASGADADHRVRPVVLRQGRQGPVRHRRPAARPRWSTCRSSPNEIMDPRQVRRRHLRPGVRQRPAGRRARDPQPGPGRVRHRRGALVAARLRPHVVDDARPDDAAKPVRVQGRNATTSRPRTPRRSTSTSGWPTGDGPDWLTGGTYLVTRRIRMRIEAWDRTTLLEQERVIGRQKGSGAPNRLRRRVRRPSTSTSRTPRATR